MPITIKAKCTRCGYTWKPRVKSPKACPECKYRGDVKIIESKKKAA